MFESPHLNPRNDRDMPPPKGVIVYMQIWFRKKSQGDSSLVEKQTEPLESQRDDSLGYLYGFLV